MYLTRLSKSNKGFTLIELLIAMTISLMVILGASSIFKFVILSWSKTTESLESLEKMSAIEHMLRTQFENFEPLKDDRNRLFFRGTANELSFVTNDSGSYEEGMVYVNYKYEKEDEFLSICIANVKDFNDIKEISSEKDESSCFNIKNITDFSFNYDIYRHEQSSNRIFNSTPEAVIVSMEISTDEDNKIKRKFYVFAD